MEKRKKGSVKYELPACGRQAKYGLKLISNIERRLKNEEVGKHGNMPEAELPTKQNLV
jgi:hypothetical protein